MAVTAKFVADFSSFTDAIDKAEVKLADFGKGAAGVEAKLNRMVDNFSGRKLIQEATLMATAIEKSGGVATLTGQQLEIAGKKAEDAADKMKKLGMEVPVGIQKIADAAADARRQTEGWIPILHNLGTSWVARITEGILLRDAIHAIIGQIKDMASALPELALRGAGIADVRENFDHLTDSAGLLGEQLLGTLRKGTHDTIDDFELMKTVNHDLVAGLNLTDEQFGVLAQGAFALAQATGGDVKTALDTMNEAMVTGRAKGIALLTGRIDLESAETKYAESLGKSRENLTDAGKLEAARVGILDAVTAATGRLGEQTDGLDEKVAQAGVAWTNFKDKLGESIATSDALGVVLDGVKNILVDTFGGSQKTLIEAITNAINDATVAVVGFGKVGVEVAGFLTKEYYAVKKIFGDIVQIIELAEVASAKITIVQAFTAAHLGNEQAKKDTADARAEIERLTASIQARGAALQADDKAQSAVDATTAAWLKRLDELQVKVKAATIVQGPFVQAFNTEAEAHAAAGAGAGKHGQELTKLTDKEKAAIEAFQTAAKNIEDLSSSFESVDGAVEEAIKYFLELGASQSDLAKYFGVSAGAIKRIDDELKTFAEIHKTTFELAQNNQKQYREEALKTAAVVNKSLIDQLDIQKTFARQLTALATTSNPGAQLLQEWADALNKLGPPMKGFEANWQKTVDSIDAYFSAKMAQGDMTEAMKAAGLEAARGFQSEFFKIIDDIPNLLKQAFTGGGGVSGAMSAVGASLGAVLGNAIATGTAGQNLSDGIAKLMGVSSAAGSGAIAKGVSGAITAGVSLAGSGAFGAAAQYAATGASIGFMVGGPVGAGIGAAIGAGGSLLVSAYKKLTTTTEMKVNQVREAAVQAAGGLAELNARAHDAGVTLDAFLDAKKPEQYQKAIDDLNKAFAALDQHVKDVGVGLKQAAGGTNALAASLLDPLKNLQKEFDTAITNAGKSSVSLAKLLLKKAPANDEEAAKYGMDLASEIGQGMRDALGDEATIGDLNKRIAQAVQDVQPTFEHLGQYVAATFAAQIHEGASAFDAFKALEPAFADLQAGISDFGLKSTATIDQLLKVQGVVGANKDVADSVQALSNIYDGLTQAGYLTKDLFESFAEDISHQFDLLVSRGADGTTALQLMQPELQKLWEGQQKFGDITDESTKKLLDQAEQQGLVGEDMKNVNDKILDVLLSIADVFGAKLPKSLQAMVDATKKAQADAQKALDGIHAPDLTIGIHYNYDNLNLPDTSGVDVRQMASGGSGRITKPTVFFSKGNEDFAFSGEGQSFGDGTGDTSGLAGELRALRDEFRAFPRAIVSAFMLHV